MDDVSLEALILVCYRHTMRPREKFMTKLLPELDNNGVPASTNAVMRLGSLPPSNLTIYLRKQALDSHNRSAPYAITIR